MQTFIFNPDGLQGEYITIDGNEAHHIGNVIRLQKGEMIRLIDGSGLAFICEIAKKSTRTITCRIIKSVKNSGEATINVALALGLSAGIKFDVAIEKGTEIGVKQFVPLLTQKGKVKLGDKSTATRKLKRWQRVAEAAAKQAHRSIIPQIAPPMGYEEFVRSVSSERSLLFHPDSPLILTENILNSIPLSEIVLIIGPESGFTDEEIALAKNHKITCCSLGQRILRTETAGVVIPALIIYFLESIKA